jgi:phosphoserine phosphatase RsbX
MGLMITSQRSESSAIEWGTAGFALEGTSSGDQHVVAPFMEGVLVAVIDGLGHGAEAAAAAQAAAHVLESNAGEPLADLVSRCHDALRRTRGAVMSLASLNVRSAAMTWAGVGNVEAVLLRANRRAVPPREALAPRGGIVGYRLPAVRPSAVAVASGDTLIMATDGIRGSFLIDLPLERSPQEIADFILARYARRSDDALVLVARYLGSQGTGGEDVKGIGGKK